MTLAGNSAKNSRYLQRIKDATSRLTHPNHPRHHGVAMQAHHIISADGMKISRLGNKIAKFGYDINALDNLVFIPCTLQGACHLGVQPHRGNHTASPTMDPDDYNDDDIHPLDYHRQVAKAIIDLQLPLDKECTGKEDRRVAEIKRKLDNLSTRILRQIQYDPQRVPLTRIASSFSPGNTTGCANTDSIPLHRSHMTCRHGRDHQNNQQAEGQRSENITIGRQDYQLRTGR